MPQNSAVEIYNPFYKNIILDFATEISDPSYVKPHLDFAMKT